MKKITTIILAVLSISIFAQKSPTEKAQPIVEEGKLLYALEMASWYGTDLFLAKYNNRDNIGGYFSYKEKEFTKCVFFSRTEKPKVIGTINFDSNYDIKKAKIDFSERNFTKYENDLYTIRKNTLNEINSDTLFSMYENTRLNLIPLINGNEKKVYIVTGPMVSGVVIFGNDYLLTFDKKNKLKEKKKIHQTMLPFYYGEEQEGEEGDKEVVGGMHSHLPETGDFITATDICTLMLYSKYAKWKTYMVVSSKYVNIWDCEKNNLLVLPAETMEKIFNDIENREKESKEIKDN